MAKFCFSCFLFKAYLGILFDITSRNLCTASKQCSLNMASIFFDSLTA